MSIAASNDPRIMTVEVTEDLIVAHLEDGRTVSVPLAWSWRLSNATSGRPIPQSAPCRPTGVVVAFIQCDPGATSTLRDYRDRARGPLADIDEDLSALGMLTGVPAPPPKHTAFSK